MTENLTEHRFNKTPTISPWRVLIPIGLGTGLSLIGDSSMYVALPTHFEAAGVTLASVGLLLSANRWIRLPLNGPAGWLYERWPRRRLFVPALFLGAISSALYALTYGFGPLLLGRLLWGLAWVGIWVGGNTIVLDISRAHNRGKWVGAYQISFFLGASSGAFLGGILTDWLGFHNAMGVASLLNIVGALVALIFLPETRGDRQNHANPKIIPPFQKPSLEVEKKEYPLSSKTSLSPKGELASATGLLAVNRLVQAGLLTATLALFFQQQLGDTLSLGNQVVGVTTLTGTAIGITTLLSMSTTPIIGALSDRVGNRWVVAAFGLAPGVTGYLLMTMDLPALIGIGLLLAAITGGSNSNLSTSLIGDLSKEGQHGRRLGVLFTVGDLASAIGPPLAFALIPLTGVEGVYFFSAGLFAVMLLVAGRWALYHKN